MRQENTDRVTCPECKGRGMIRPAGEWHNETCPTCHGRGEVDRQAAATNHPSAA